MSDPMQQVYLASRYSRHDEMQGVRDVLEALCGVKVTSRWIDLHGGTAPESRTADQLHTDPDGSSVYALHDLEDLRAADTVISFTDGSNSSKGGRHVEFGAALALGKRVIVVGPRENVFHTLPQVEWFPDWPHLVMSLTRAAHREIASCPCCDKTVDVWPPADCEEPEFHATATYDCDCGDVVTIAEAIANPERHRRCNLIGSRS